MPRLMRLKYAGPERLHWLSGLIAPDRWTRTIIPIILFRRSRTLASYPHIGPPQRLADATATPFAIVVLPPHLQKQGEGMASGRRDTRFQCPPRAPTARDPKRFSRSFPAMRRHPASGAEAKTGEEWRSDDWLSASRRCKTDTHS